MRRETLFSKLAHFSINIYYFFILIAGHCIEWRLSYFLKRKLFYIKNAAKYKQKTW